MVFPGDCWDYYYCFYCFYYYSIPYSILVLSIINGAIFDFCTSGYLMVLPRVSRLRPSCFEKYLCKTSQRCIDLIMGKITSRLVEVFVNHVGFDYAWVLCLLV